MMKARIVNNLVDVCEKFFGIEEGHRDDPGFLALTKRIEGQVVDLIFTGDDAFEKEDNNYWLPNCSWTPIEVHTDMGDESWSAPTPQLKDMR